MFSLQTIFGSGKQFYGLLESAAASALDSARALQVLAKAATATPSLEEFKRVRQREREILQQINAALVNTFVTPIEREDILDLASALDDIVDFIEEVADYLALYRIEAPMDQAQELARILHQACREVNNAIPRLRTFGDIRHFTVEINRLENEGDRKVREALASLFEHGIDPMMVIRWKDIFERLEEAIDSTERAANILEGVMIKNR